MSGELVDDHRTPAGAPTWTRELIGRDEEIARLLAFLDNTSAGSAHSLLLVGQAGVGKSSLLSFADAHGRSSGMHVLRTTGIETDSHRPFGALQHLLRPVVERINHLHARYRDALLSAFGLADDPIEDPFLAGLATLELLSDVATTAPVLVIIDDVQWSDPCTIDAMVVMTRRLGDEPVWLLAASRDGYDGHLMVADPDELRVGPLDNSASQALLDQVLPGSDRARRAEILNMSAGNPLALVELSRSSSAFGVDAMPLTRRIEKAFAGRLSDLPERTRAAVLMAAVEGSDSTVEILNAASSLTGGPLGLNDLAPAAAAQLVVLDGHRLMFPHPLVRSAVKQTAGLEKCASAHTAWAGVLVEQPDRALWHRAAATLGTDSGLADELDGLAMRVRRRGAPGTALAALERGAELSADPLERARRMFEAAEIAFEIGRRDTVERLLRGAEALDRRPDSRARAIWVRERFDDGLSGATIGIAALAGTALDTYRAGGRSMALNLLATAGIRCWWANPTPLERQAVIDVIEEIGSHDGEPVLVAVLAWVAALEREPEIVDHLRRATARGLLDPGAARLLGAAAICIGEHPLAGGFLDAAADGFRRDGRVALLAQTLLLRTWNSIHMMHLDDAAADATEGERLARESAQPFWAPRAQAALALIAGLRGDTASAEELAGKAERVVFPRGISSVVADVQLARGATALANRDHQAAFDHLRRMFDPDDAAFHFVKRCWSVGDLAEAAVHIDQREAAIKILADVRHATAQSRSPHIVAAVRHATAILADDSDADSAFREAVTTPAQGSAFERARLQFAYGAWLRRRRRVAESREPLRLALATFDALGVVSWGQQARDELRASGETARSRSPDALDHLTPQELQIARLAAEGLANREIGQRLYLSPRTIGSHLYRIFPKLGVTSRTQLAAKLEELNLRRET